MYEEDIKADNTKFMYNIARGVRSKPLIDVSYQVHLINYCQSWICSSINLFSPSGWKSPDRNVLKESYYMMKQ